MAQLTVEHERYQQPHPELDLGLWLRGLMYKLYPRQKPRPLAVSTQDKKIVYSFQATVKPAHIQGSVDQD